MNDAYCQTAFEYLTYLSKATLANDGDKLKVFQLQRGALSSYRKSGCNPKKVYLGCTYTARLKSHRDLNSTLTAREIIPLVLPMRLVKVGHESDTTEVDIVAHIIRNTVAATFRLLRAQVALYRDLRLTRHIAVQRPLVKNRTELLSKCDAGRKWELTSSSRTYIKASGGHRPRG